MIISTFKNSAAAISSGRWRDTRGRIADSVLYPDDHTSMGRDCALCRSIFSCLLAADLVRRFRSEQLDWSALPDKVAIQLNDTHPTMAVPELMRILLDEAHLGWDEAGTYTKDSGVYQPHATSRSS
jgi:starch phosphorylase